MVTVTCTCGWQLGPASQFSVTQALIKHEWEHNDPVANE